MDLEDGLGYRNRCFVGCCGYQGCAMAVGIVCLVLACLHLSLLTYGVMAFPYYTVQGILCFKLSRASFVSVSFDIFIIIINVLLIVGAKTKNKKFVLVWVYGNLYIISFLFASSIFSLFARMMIAAVVKLIGAGILCCFIWVVAIFQVQELQ